LTGYQSSQSILAGKRPEFLRTKSRLICQFLRCSFEDFEVQTALTFEMIIDGGLINASLGDYVPHARALEALIREQIDGGLNNGVARIFGRSDHGPPN
jgi:hypothetical protein